MLVYHLIHAIKHLSDNNRSGKPLIWGFVGEGMVWCVYACYWWHDWRHPHYHHAVYTLGCCQPVGCPCVQSDIMMFFCDGFWNDWSCSQDTQAGILLVAYVSLRQVAKLWDCKSKCRNVAETSKHIPVKWKLQRCRSREILLQFSHRHEISKIHITPDRERYYYLDFR